MKSQKPNALLIALLSTFFTSHLFAVTVEFRIQTTDANGDMIDQVTIGERFWLDVSVQDKRHEPSGVLSAFLDVNFDSARATLLAATLEHGADFGELVRGDTTTPGTLNEFGSFARGYLSVPPLPSPLGGDVYRLFRIGFQAERIGRATFTGDPADVLPRHSTTVHGVDSAVTDLAFMNTAINIVPEPSGLVFAMAVFVMTCVRRPR